jgi:hypothetical protein
MQVTSQPPVSNSSASIGYAPPQPVSARSTDATSALVDWVLGRPPGGASPQQYAYSTPQYAMPQQYDAPQQQAGDPTASKAPASNANAAAAMPRGFVTQDDKGQWYYLEPVSAAELAQIQAKGYQGPGQLVQGSDGNAYLALAIKPEEAAQFIQAQQAAQQSASPSAQNASIPAAENASATAAVPQSTVITGNDGKQYLLEPMSGAEVAQAQAAGAQGNFVQDANGQVYRATQVQSQTQGASPAVSNGSATTTPPQSTVITGADGKQYLLEPMSNAEVAQAQAAGAQGNFVQGPDGQIYRATQVQSQSQGAVGGALPPSGAPQRVASGGGNDYRFYMGVQDPGGPSPFVGPAVNLLSKGVMAIPAVQQWNSTVMRPNSSAQNVASSIGGGGSQTMMMSTTPNPLSGSIGTSSTLSPDTFALNVNGKSDGGVFSNGGTSTKSSSNSSSNVKLPADPKLVARTQAEPKSQNSNQALSNGLGLGSSILDSAAQFAAAGGAPAGVTKGLQVAGAGLSVANNIVNNRPIDAALAGAGGIAAAIGGKAGQTIGTAVSVAATAKSIVGDIRAGGPTGFASAAGSALGLAANFIKGTAGKVVSGLGQAATTAVNAAKAVASGVASVAGAVGGGIVAGVGIIASLVGGKVGKWVSNIAGIVAPLLMSNPIGAIIGAVGLLASLLFKRRLKLTSDQQADLLGRGAGMASGAAGTALNAGAAGATDPNAKKPLDRLHRTANNQLEVFINDGTGKETKTQTLSMGGYFDKKRKAGQDKLVDLLDRGLPDLIWQGDKKNANHITTFVNLGGGKFGDPLAADRAAKRMAAMEDYIRTHPRPTFEFPDDTSSAATKAMYRGNDGVNTKAQLAKAYADDLTYNGAPEFHPGFHNAGSPPKTYNGILVSKANAWLDGLAEAINNAVQGATGGGGGVIRKGNMMFDRTTGQKTENQIGDQTRISGVANPYKGTESQMVGYQNGFHGTRSGGFVPEVLRRTGTTANSKYSVEHGDSDSGGPSLMRANTYNGVDPMRDKDFQEEAIADANKRVGLVIDDAIGTMRKQLEAQANPEGRVYAEQTLDLKVKKYDPSQMKFADVNSDGYADMIMSGKYVQGGTWVFLNKGDATFETKGIDISAEIAALEAQQKAADAAAAPPAAAPAPTPAPANALPASRGLLQRSNDPRQGGSTNVASGAPTKPGQFDPSVRAMATQRGVLV